MNTASASRVESPAATGPRVLVWDAPVRAFHWLMVFSFAGAYLTSDSESWRLVHVTLGYTMAGLVAFRVLWGLVGTRHARFTAFVRGPRAVMACLGSLLRGRPQHHTGHNPAGALAIVALLALTAGVTAAGWATYNELAGEWTEDLHETLANVMLAVVLVHVGAVVLSSLLHKENLAGAMVTGYKVGSPGEGIRRAWHSVAALMLAAVLAFWWYQWQVAPQGELGAAATAGERERRPAHGEDDD